MKSDPGHEDWNKQGLNGGIWRRETQVYTEFKTIPFQSAIRRMQAKVRRM